MSSLYLFRISSGLSFFISVTLARFCHDVSFTGIVLVGVDSFFTGLGPLPILLSVALILLNKLFGTFSGSLEDKAFLSSDRISASKAPHRLFEIHISCKIYLSAIAFVIPAGVGFFKSSIIPIVVPARFDSHPLTLLCCTKYEFRKSCCIRLYFQYAAFAPLSPAISPVEDSIASSNLAPKSSRNFERDLHAVSLESAATLALSANICHFISDITVCSSSMLIQDIYLSSPSTSRAVSASHLRSLLSFVFGSVRASLRESVRSVTCTISPPRVISPILLPQCANPWSIASAPPSIVDIFDDILPVRESSYI